MALRTETEKALDELISNEEGMRFQGLAVILAKNRWPEFIASERKDDLGLDAHMPATLAPDRKGKGLACSLTAELGKIEGDIKRFRSHYENVEVLIFSTPKKVTKEASQKWIETVYEKHRIELIIVSREDIITDLMMPSNAKLCRNLLGIEIAIEPSVTELLEKTREATSNPHYS